MGNTNIQHSPLNTLQVTRFEKDDFYQLVQAINSRLRPRPVEAEILREDFEERWPKLEAAVHAAIEQEEEREAANIQPEDRPVPDILEDVLTAMRNVRNDVRRMQAEVIPRGERDAALHNAIQRDVLRNRYVYPSQRVKSRQHRKCP
jgi:hypothetical protein